MRYLELNVKTSLKIFGKKSNIKKAYTFLQDLIKSFADSGKPVGAICAAPLLLHDTGLLNSESNCTAHESTSNELPNLVPDQAVVRDGKIITSRGAGTAVEFGLSLIKLLFCEEKENEIRASIHADLSSNR